MGCPSPALAAHLRARLREPWAAGVKGRGEDYAGRAEDMPRCANPLRLLLDDAIAAEIRSILDLSDSTDTDELEHSTCHSCPVKRPKGRRRRAWTTAYVPVSGVLSVASSDKARKDALGAAAAGRQPSPPPERPRAPLGSRGQRRRAARRLPRRRLVADEAHHLEDNRSLITSAPRFRSAASSGSSGAVAEAPAPEPSGRATGAATEARSSARRPRRNRIDRQEEPPSGSNSKSARRTPQARVPRWAAAFARMLLEIAPPWCAASRATSNACGSSPRCATPRRK